MRNRKWMIAVVLMLALSLALFGCGNKDEEEKPDDSQQQDQQQEEQQGSGDEEQTDDSPYAQYKEVCKQMQAIDSAAYKARQEVEIEYSEDDEQKVHSRARVQEVYTDDSMNMAYRSTFSTFGTKGKLNIFYKDGTLYYDNDGKRSKQQAKLKKLLNKTMVYSNPYAYLKGSSIFKIDEEDLAGIRADTDDGVTEIEMTLKDTCIDKYFVLDLDEESSLYGSGFTPKNYEIEIALDGDGAVKSIDMSYDMELSAGKGEVSWDCDITGINNVSEIDYPDYVE